MKPFNAVRDELLKKYGNKDDGEKEKQESTQGQKTPKKGAELVREKLLNKYNRTSEVTEFDIEQFQLDASKFLSSYEKAAKNIGYSNHESLYSARKSEWESLRERGDKIAAYLEKNRDRYGEEAFNNFQKYWGSVSKASAQQLMAIYRSKDYFSRWESEEDYNSDLKKQEEINAFEEDHGTYEGRQAWYTEQQSRLEQLKAEKSTLYGEWNKLAEDAWGGPYSEEFYAKKQGYIDRINAIDDEIAFIETEMRNYERGNFNEYGQYYGTKAADDYHPISQRPDFDSVSADRDADNPTRDELTMYDTMRDSSTWYRDANGVYRDAFGNELVVDANGHWVNPKAQENPVKDRLGMFLRASEDELQEAIGTPINMEGTWASVLKDGVDGSWDQLTEGEIGIYYYLLNTDGQEAADKYLDDMKTELNRRETIANQQKNAQLYEDAGSLEKLLLNVATVPANLFGGIAGGAENLAHTIRGEDINPYSFAQSGMHFSNTIRGETAEDIDANGGGRIWGLTDLTGFTLGDAYQSGMSILDSYASIGIGGKLGGLLLATNAANSEAVRLYEQGASRQQIALGSAAAGAAEMVFESISIEKLITMKDAKTVGQVVKNALIQGGIEASEEGFTEIANIITNSIIMGNQSDWARLVQEYNGDEWQAFLSKVKDVANASIGGFLSGAGSATVPSAVSYGANSIAKQAQYASEGKDINYAYGRVDALLSLANELAGVTVGRVQRNLNRDAAAVGKKATDRRVGKLYESVQTANNFANASQNQADIAKSLTRKGFKAETANDIAEALIAKYNGKTLTKAQSRLLESVENSKHVKAVISDIINNDQSTMGQRSQNIRDFDQGVYRGIVTKAVQKAVEKQFTPEGTYETSVDGKAIRTATGEVVEIKGIASIRKGEMLLDIGDGNTINAKDVSYASKEQALIYEAIANLGDKIDPKSANELISLYDGKNAALFARGIAQAYSFGFDQFDKAELASKSSFTSDLTAEQRNNAYRLGNDYRHVKDRSDKDNAHTTKAPAEKGVYYRDQNGNATDISTYLKSSNVRLNERQKTAIEAMRKFSETMGARFNVFESWEENGKRYYLDENGVKTQGNPNGFYDPKTGEIYIALDAGADSSNKFRDTMLFTIAHELTHFMKQWSPEHFTKISKIVFAHAGFKGRVSELVADKMEARKKKGKPISYDTAVEEVVADAMETILKDGKVVEFMAEVKQKDHTAWQKLKGWFKNLEKFLRKLVVAYRGEHANTTEGDMVANFAEDTIRQIEQIFAEGAVAAGENYKAAMENVVAENAETVSADEIITDGAVVTDGEGTKYSIKSMKHDIAEGQMFEDLKTYCGWTQKQVNELRNNLNDLVEYMIPFRDILDMNETYGREGRRFSPYKPNSDPLYKISMDFSTLCSKRLLTQYVIENLQLRENRPMSAEEQMAIRDMLNEYRKVEKGLQVACAMCYVEAARLKSPQQIGKWLADPETQMRNYFADKDPEFAAFIKEKQADFKESRGYARNATKKDMTAKDVRELNKIRPRLRSRYQLTAEELEIVERAKALPNSTYLTAGNLADLSESEPVIYTAYTAFVRTATRSKSLETDEPYYYGDSRRDNGNGIIVSDSFIEAVNRENGMRFSSWSDWRIQHLLDYITAVIDNSVRGAAMHGYTKFGEEVRVLGKTGMMFNMSGVAGTQTGLNEDGSLSFSPTESMDVDEAIQLREEFPETAGLQCIGVSDAHIIALLRSDIIDYIIPYHVSGLNAALRRMADIYGWSDYTTTQHAAIDKSIKFENAVDQEHWHEEPVWSEFFVGYDTGMTGIEAMRASADRYVQMCKDRGLKPKFEQFLKEENYWKLLIDRKMINQKTGKLIQQKAVTPTFDFGTIKEVVDRYVKNYDSGLEARALNHIVENWDSIPKRIKDLKKQGGTKAKKASKAVDTLANETIAAQPATKMSGRDIPEGLSPAKYNALLTRKPIQASKKDWAKVEQARMSKYSEMEDSEIPDLDIFRLAEYGKVNEGYLYFVRNSGKDNFVIVGKKQIVPAKRYVIREEQIAYEESNGRKKTHQNDDRDGSGRRTDAGDSERSGDGSKLRENDTGTGGNEKTVQNSDTWNGTSDSGTVKLSDRDSDGNQLSAEQQEFFKDSKVRDKKGNLLIVYHGTTANFSVFKKGDIGFHFGTKGAARGRVGYGKNVNIKAVYLNITNPIVFDEDLGSWDADYRLTRELYDRGILTHDEAMSVLRTDDGRYKRSTEAANKKLASVLEAKGYDGIAYKNTFETKKATTSYIAFSSNQAKETTNISPTSNPDIRYQDRAEESVSNRSLLANAFEGLAQNEIERNKIQEYKEKINQANAEERKLRELNEQIKELSFANGPRDTKKIRELQFEARQTANRISTYDNMLLRLEASKPLQDVLNREKEKVRKMEKQKGKDALEAYREKTMKTQRELIEKWQESRKKGIDSRNRTAMRHKIKDIVNELNQYLLRGTKDRHVPIKLQKAVAEALDAVNMDTVGAEERIAKLKDELLKARSTEQIQEISRKIDHIQAMGDKMNDRLQKLKDAYDQFVNSDDPMIANSHDEVISNKLQSVINSIGNTPLRDMNLSQLEDVYDMYRMVMTTIRNANKAFKAKKNESISTIANRVMQEVDKVGGKKKFAIKGVGGIKSFAWNNLKPVYAFEHIGSGTFTEVFNNVRAGEDVWAVDVTEAREFYLDKSKKHGYDSWDLKKRYNFKSTSGMEFELDLEQIMSLYAYSKRDHAADHLKYGGIVFDESTKIVKKTKLGLSLEFNPTEATAYNISEDTLADIVSKLSKEQKAFVDEMQDYLSTVMGAKGNEVSLAMYGVKLFKEKFYFPLKSAHQFMAKAKEQQKGEVKIKNSGFSKETKPHATNPIVLTPFMNVWSDHVNEMSMYHAFVLPMEDFYRVYSYKTPSNNEALATESVEMFIQNAYGKGATGYIDQLLKDLNGGARTDSTTGIINKMMGLFKKGAVFASLSVVVQQPSAIARAAALVDTKYFIGPKVDHKTHKLLWNEVKQYAPVAIIKEMGYFDTNMGKSTHDFITGKEYSGFKEKMKALVTDSNYRDEALSKAPALADEIAWCSIWEAVKRETKAKNPGMDVKSEAFLKKAGERFTEVIVKTQVYDSVLSRSGLMRSKDTGMKMATAFMAEPTTSINMIADALLQGKRGNWKYARGAIGAVIASQILNSILVSFVYAARDDDEDKTYVEKYFGTLAGELLDSLNPAGYIPFIKDIMSIVQGYDVERSDMAIISDLWNAWENLSKDNVSTYRKVEGFAGSIAQIFGLPVKNIMRDVRGIYQTIDSFVNGEHTTAAGIGYAVKSALPEWMGGGDVSKQNQLYEAMLSGDKEQIDRVKARFKDQSAIDSAIRKALRENDPRIREAAIAWNANDLDEYMRLAKAIIAEKHFSQDDVVMAIRAEASALAPDTGSTGSTGSSKAKGLFTVEKFVEAIAHGDEATANAAKIDIIQTSQVNGKSAEEAEKSFASSVKSEMKERFLAGTITEDQVIDTLMDYCGETYEDAEKIAGQWSFEQEYGFSYSDRGDAYKSGAISAQELIDILVNVGGKTEEDAIWQVKVYDWQNEGFDIDSNQKSVVEDYETFCEPAGIDKDIYFNAYLFYADSGEEGVSYSKTIECMPYIDSLPLTPYQKTQLALCWWAASTVNKYKTW